MRSALCLVILFVGAASAQERTHDVTPDDYFTLATVTELAVSPDGKLVVYCEGRWDKADDGRKTDLWVVATDGKGAPKRLTGDRANDRGPKWSNDGKTIYFVGNRKREAEKKPPYDGTSQVWSVAAEGGEVKAVTRVEGGISGYDYAPTVDSVYYTADTSATDDDDFAKLRARHKANYGHGTRATSEIHKLDLKTWRTEKVVDDNRYVREFVVSPDGKRIAMVSAVDDTVLKSEGESRVDVWEAGKVMTPPTEVYRAKAASPHAWLEGLAWSPDGERVAFCAIFDAYPTELVVITKDSETWVTKVVKRGDVQVHGYGTPLQWITNQTVLFFSHVRGDVSAASANVTTDLVKILPNEAGAVTYAIAWPAPRSGSGIVRVRSTGTELATLVATMPQSNAPDKVTTLVDPNPHTATWKQPTVQHITWKAPAGTEVGGALELPFGYKKGDKLPLVVAIHGGPTTASDANLNFDPHNGRLYFAAKGYAVLLPNYRGSTGYGDKFVTDLVGNENDIEVKDILAGIQHLVKEGIADPDRVGVMGWSNGGYLTNCLITLKDPPVKFKAASSGAGILDTAMEWGINDEPAYPMVFKKGLPWDQPDLYKKTSPSYGLGNVTTPTLIHVGGNDVRCPPEHSRMLYRALKEYKKVPTELVVYPGEPHGLGKMSHRKAKMEWDLAWFEKYLKDK